MSATLPTTEILMQGNTDTLDFISAGLQDVELIIEKELASERPEFQEIIAHVAKYKGKRLRPALLMACAHACGTVTNDHSILGAVVEIIHTASLVHDDVLDSAQVRRHLPAVHTLWGVKSAVLLGDCMFTKAFHMASKLENPRACRVIGRSANRVCAGEMLQGFHSGNLDLTEDIYLDIIDGKTAEMIAASCELGAAYAGANEETVLAMESFGRNLGLAFQIADDILDLVGQETLTGKSLGTDLEQKKLTLPIIWLLQNGSKAEKMKIKELLTLQTPNQRALVKNLASESGALDYSQKKALSYLSTSRKDLKSLPASPFKTTLLNMTDKVLNRSC